MMWFADVRDFAPLDTVNAIMSLCCTCIVNIHNVYNVSHTSVRFTLAFFSRSQRAQSFT